MELTNKKEYRNHLFSIGVTVFSFVVMLAFFIYTNISNACSSLEYDHLQNALKDRSKTLNTLRSDAAQSGNAKSTQELKENVTAVFQTKN